MTSSSEHKNRGFFPEWLNILLDRENPPDRDHIVIIHTPKEYLDAGHDFLLKKNTQDKSV
jgi:hypothetical protein